MDCVYRLTLMNGLRHDAVIALGKTPVQILDQVSTDIGGGLGVCIHSFPDNHKMLVLYYELVDVTRMLMFCGVPSAQITML